jgi:ribosomal protein L21E
MKETKKQSAKIGKVMHEYKAGTLNTGSKTGPVVKSRKQAVAIAMSQAGMKKKPTKKASSKGY